MNDLSQREVFVRNIKKYMKERGVEQIDIVSKLGYTASTVSDWVNGKKYPRVDAMQQLASFLNVSISDLTREEGEEKGKHDNKAVARDDDEKELLQIFRKLDRRQRHEMMAKAYELERSTNKSGIS